MNKTTKERIQEIVTKVEMLHPIDDIELKIIRVMCEALVAQAKLEQLQSK